MTSTCEDATRAPLYWHTCSTRTKIPNLVSFFCSSNHLWLFLINAGQEKTPRLSFLLPFK
ncbi:hypothetical protein IscW_ISCW001267 [Ixodes scapularis]|uniref:Uncharacterized protein n=1 Tax=Ixodes scapularis TaxID=6945 RepID=B7P1T0_IXOSC|nr:hypothetical protein IscW_ISCW001267 [Ixodes scapularis]|eukprot:XP_002433488.1 hypothetical protein IscW_ISCW001267 [Ixodes scapularis]